jgi:hypothetical protein
MPFARGPILYGFCPFAHFICPGFLRALPSQGPTLPGLCPFFANNSRRPLDLILRGTKPKWVLHGQGPLGQTPCQLNTGEERGPGWAKLLESPGEVGSTGKTRVKWVGLG